jgi:hypothetical protein
MSEAARDPPKAPLLMKSRSVPPPEPMVPDQFQICSGREEVADSEAKVSTPLVAPTKRDTHFEDPADGKMGGCLRWGVKELRLEA